MATLNDCKLAALAAETALTGSINDLELIYVQSLIVAATKADDLTGAWQQYFAEQGHTGSYNDNAFAWLAGLGHSGSLNEKWLAYWCALVPV